MPDYIRVTDLDTGHKLTIVASALPHGNYRELQAPAVNIAGEPLPPEHNAVAVRGTKAKKSTAVKAPGKKAAAKKAATSKRTASKATAKKTAAKVESAPPPLEDDPGDDLVDVDVDDGGPVEPDTDGQTGHPQPEGVS